MWGVRIGGTFLCIGPLGMGLKAAWGCMIADNLLLLVCFRLYYRKTKLLPEDKPGVATGRDPEAD